MTELDKETIDTDAGQYTVTWYHDDSANQPYDFGFTLMKNGGRDRIDVSTVGEDQGIPSSLVSEIESLLKMHSRHGYGDYWDRDYRSGAALVRYLTLKGYKGVTLVSDDYSPEDASTNRLEAVHGIAWAPDDVPATLDDNGNYPATYVKIQLTQWRAWAEGDMFGYVVTGPDGEDVEDGAVWGYYGFWDGGEREYTLSQAKNAAEADAAERVQRANLVGAGIVGIV